MADSAAKLLAAIEAFKKEHGDDLSLRYVIADLGNVATHVEKATVTHPESPGAAAAREAGVPGDTPLTPPAEEAKQPSSLEEARQAAMERLKQS